MSFPILYSYNQNGKKQFWSISVQKNSKDSDIIINYGVENGKVRTIKVTIFSGKNIGKANEKSHYEQALSEAQSKWNKKRDLGYYTESELNKKNKQVSTILPMLAVKFIERSKDINFPCYVQPKVDGIRAIYNPINKKFQSRTGKLFPHLDHLINELNNIDENLILDGELYSYNLSFQEISGIIQKEKLNDDTVEKLKNIIFIVYDTVLLDKDFSDRYLLLTEFFKNNEFKYLQILKTEICKSIEDIPLFLEKYEKEGYEGLIIRNFKGKYKLKHRSKDLQKLKTFEDDEFEIVSFTEGTGIEKGLVIWICKTKENKIFNVRPKGTHEEREKLFKNGNKYIGKMLTVRFFGYTNDSIPRFPVGIGLRNYE